MQPPYLHGLVSKPVVHRLGCKVIVTCINVRLLHKSLKLTWSLLPWTVSYDRGILIKFKRDYKIKLPTAHQMDPINYIFNPYQINLSNINLHVYVINDYVNMATTSNTFKSFNLTNRYSITTITVKVL